MGRHRLPFAMTLAEAVQIAGTLGHPSKMPGYSYGLSARRCQTGSRLRGVPGSICSGCYAMSDFYATWTPLALGHARRHLGLDHPRWCDAMVRMISAACIAPHNYFRWHDSGDLQSAEHLARIVEVCTRTPSVTHWLPTREYAFVVAFVAGGGVVPPNLTIRLSAHMVDAQPVIPPELASWPTSTVSSVPQDVSGARIVDGKGAIECRAVEKRGNRCGDCRACWDPRVVNVNYPQH